LKENDIQRQTSYRILEKKNEEKPNKTKINWHKLGAIIIGFLMLMVTYLSYVENNCISDKNILFNQYLEKI